VGMPSLPEQSDPKEIRTAPRVRDAIFPPHPREQRLRVGDSRVRFIYEALEALVVVRVSHRKDAYR
jgi:hypothetical protein